MFRKDYARLIHSAAFRRLQGKTQVFAGLESDFFRNRLTHSLEVAQIARSLAVKLNHQRLDQLGLSIDLDLVEFAGLAHDLGHPPFGHTGEAKLDELMREYGGFEGNAQTFRILARLEKKLDNPDGQLQDGSPLWYDSEGNEAGHGLNLCARSLASIVKYDNKIESKRPPKDKVVKGYYSCDAPPIEFVREKIKETSPVDPIKVIECQIMDLADDIAYSTYDIEDAFKAGLLNPLDLLYPVEEALSQVAQRVSEDKGLDVTINRAGVEEVLKEGPLSIFWEPFEGVLPEDKSAYFEHLGTHYRAAKETAESGFRRTALTSSLVGEAIAAVDVEGEEPSTLRVTMKQEVHLRVAVFKHLIYVLLISSSRFKLVAHRAQEVVQTIFKAIDSEGGESLLPEDFQQRFRQAGEPEKRRVICDFIAGMTDRYAVEFYARLSSDTFYTMFKPG